MISMSYHILCETMLFYVTNMLPDFRWLRGGTVLSQHLNRGGRRATLIIRDLRNLTTGPQRHIEPVDLRKLVRQTVSRLERRLPLSIKLETELDSMPLVMARAGLRRRERAPRRWARNATRAQARGRAA